MTCGTILVVDPNRLFRESLKLLLVNLQFSANVEDFGLDEVLDSEREFARCDLVIWSVGVRTISVSDLVQLGRLRLGSPMARVVVLGDAFSRDEFLQLLGAGVDAILSKDISAEVLQRSLELVLLGQRVFPTSAAQLLVEPGAQEVAEASPEPSTRAVNGSAENSAMLAPIRRGSNAGDALSLEPRRTVVLSERENQVLRYLIKGYSNKAIARNLDISEATVKVHVKALLRKIRATNRTQAAIWALNHRVREDLADAPPLALAG